MMWLGLFLWYVGLATKHHRCPLVSVYRSGIPIDNAFYKKEAERRATNDCRVKCTESPGTGASRSRGRSSLVDARRLVAGKLEWRRFSYWLRRYRRCLAYCCHLSYGPSSTCIKSCEQMESPFNHSRCSTGLWGEEVSFHFFSPCSVGVGMCYVSSYDKIRDGHSGTAQVCLA